MATKNAASTVAPPLLTRPQVAAALNMSERWVREHTDTGAIPCVRLGTAVRYRPEDVELLRTEGLPR